MQFQWDWAGTQLVNKRVLVAPDMLDVPQRQLGTIILPPDPLPIMNARVENYPIDEIWSLMMEGGNNHGSIPLYLEASTVGSATDTISLSLELSTEP